MVMMHSWARRARTAATAERLVITICLAGRFFHADASCAEVIKGTCAAQGRIHTHNTRDKHDLCCPEMNGWTATRSN